MMAKHTLVHILVIALFALTSCGVTPKATSNDARGGTNPATGSASNPKAVATSTNLPAGDLIAFDTHILPIMKAHCESCHSTKNPTGGYDLTVFDPRTKWQIQVKHQLEIGSMPPQGAGTQLSTVEMNYYEDWIKAGAPKDQAEAKVFRAQAAAPGLVAFDCKANPPWGIQRGTVFQTDDMIQASLYKFLTVPFTAPAADPNINMVKIPKITVTINGANSLNLYNYGSASQLLSAIAYLPQDHTVKHFDAERPFSVGYTMGVVNMAQKLADMLRGATGVTPENYRFLATNFIAAGDTSCTTINDACIQKIISGLGYRAWRGEASDKLTLISQKYTSLRSGGMSLNNATSVAVAAILSDANFTAMPDTHGQFQGAVGGFTGSSKDLATKMAFFLTGTAPDLTLIKAAESADLTADKTTLRAQFDRLVATPDFNDRMYKIFSQMFNYDQINPPPTYTPVGGWAVHYVYPGTTNDITYDVFTASVKEEMRQFTLYLVNHDAPLTDFITSRIGFPNDPNVAQIYGVPTSNVPVELPPDRMGFATRIGFLTEATSSRSSIGSVQYWEPDMIHKRGYPLAVVLGNQTFSPPPAGVAFSSGNSAPGVLTPRDIIRDSTKSVPCNFCHENKGINAFGYTLDVYDAIGQRRSQWPVSKLVGKGNVNPTVPVAIDTSATFNILDMGITGTYADWPSLAMSLAKNDNVKKYLTRRLYTSLFGNVSPLTPLCNIDAIGLDADRVSIKEILWRIINTDEFNKFLVTK